MSVRVLASYYLFPYFLKCSHCKVPLQIDYPRDLDIVVGQIKVGGLKSVQQIPTVTCPLCKKDTSLPKKDWAAVLESLEADGKHKK